MAGRRIILFELNEVPLRILDEFCRWRPNSILANKLRKCFQYETFAEDEEPLSPWITWPSLHRGIPSDMHMIHDFGQDLEDVNQEYPPIWKILVEHGVTTGVFGSLHTYPPDDLEKYEFFVPDTFAGGPEAAPAALSVFQDFNLRMARRSARNVSTGVPWMAALKLALHAPSLGLRGATYRDVGRQLAAERSARWKTARRRTYQSVIAFDIFEKLLWREKPAFATFFSNHVASCQHRFWAARFPDDYDEYGYDADWQQTFAGEIEFAMHKADDFFGRLVRFVDANDEYQLWLTSSMGQEATKAEPVETQLYISDRGRFMSALGLGREDWKECPAMLPRYTFAISSDKRPRFRDAVSKIAVLGEPLQLSEEGERFFLKLGQINLHTRGDSVTLGGNPIPIADLGLKNIEIEDRSNTTAYHVPHGSLVIYDPRSHGTLDSDRVTVTTLDITPTILANFGVPVPDYMRRPSAIAGH